MKRIGFLSFGHWSDAPYSQVRSATDALIQSIELAEAIEALGADGAYFRVHHFARQLGSPFPLLAAVGARTSRIEIGTAVIDTSATSATRMFANPPGLLRLEPHSEGLRDRIWWGAGTRATAEWTAQQGLNLMSSTLLTEDAGVPFHVLQAEQIQRFRDAWTAAGNEREPRVSVSRSIFPIMDDRDRAYFGDSEGDQDHVGYLDARTRATFGRTYVGEPDSLARQLVEDSAIAAADTLMLTIPNQLGVEYNAHVVESVVRYVAPELGWR